MPPSKSPRNGMTVLYDRNKQRVELKVSGALAVLVVVAATAAIITIKLLM